MSINKILIIVTPSNNFWFKSEKTTLNGINYDKRINNYNCVYYNWAFIKKFYDQIANHPRCAIGYLNSMVLKNLKPCIECIPLEIKNFTKFLIFDQSTHDNNNPDKKDKPNFIRDMNKIIKETDNSFNETNIVILESESEKSENIKSNMIDMNVYSEKYFHLTAEEKERFGTKIDELLEFLLKLLNECDTDVREYLSKNSI